jgi:hypothetical protein
MTNTSEKKIELECLLRKKIEWFVKYSSVSQLILLDTEIKKLISSPTYTKLYEETKPTAVGNSRSNSAQMHMEDIGEGAYNTIYKGDTSL